MTKWLQLFKHQLFLLVLVRKNKMVLYKEQVQFLKMKINYTLKDVIQALCKKNTIKHFKCVFDMIGANIFVKKGHQMVIFMTT